MPKELIHFTIAERTAQRLYKTRFAPHLQQAEDALLLGSVLHDAMFYAVTASDKPLGQWAHGIHGHTGQDTYTLIRIQTKHASQAKNKSVPVALLVGIISHLFADVTIHPMVYYFSGDYYAEDPEAKSLSRQQHRGLESLMDMVACPEKLGRARYRLRNLLRRCPEMGETGLPMREIALLAGMNLEDAKLGFSRAWNLFALLQGLFPLRWLARRLYQLRPFSPSFVAETGTLFYAPQLLKDASALTNTIIYRHPVTGEPLEATLDELMNRAADGAASFCQTLEVAVFDKAPFPITGQGPTLDTGLVGVGTTKMRYFASRPLPQYD